MIRFSKLTDYAVVILATLAGVPEGHSMSASAIAQKTGLPDPTVAKILKNLAKSPLVSASRGVRGGYMIGRRASEITVAEIIAVMEGPVSLTACVDGGQASSCGYEASCPVKGRWDTVNMAVKSALDSVTLADMIRPSCAGGNYKTITIEERI